MLNVFDFSVSRIHMLTYFFYTYIYMFVRVCVYVKRVIDRTAHIGRA